MEAHTMAMTNRSLRTIRTVSKEPSLSTADKLKTPLGARIPRRLICHHLRATQLHPLSTTLRKQPACPSEHNTCPCGKWSTNSTNISIRQYITQRETLKLLRPFSLPRPPTSGLSLRPSRTSPGLCFRLVRIPSIRRR